MRRWGLTIACSLVVELAASRVWAGAPTLDECDAKLPSALNQREGWGCYYEAARGGADWADAEQRVREASSRHPSEHGYDLFALANLIAAHDPDAAIELYEQAIARFEQRGDELATILAALNLAHHYRVAAQPERAATILDAAEQAAERHGDPRWIATTKVERVRHTLRTGGDLVRALHWLAEAEPLLFPDGDYQARITWLNSAGMVHVELGRTSQAEVFFDRLIATARDHGDALSEANARYNRVLGWLERMAEAGTRDDQAAIVSELEQIEALARAGENVGVEIAASCTRGDLLGDEASIAACLVRARELGDLRLIADALIGRAWALAGDPASAVEAELIAMVDEAEQLAIAAEDSFVRTRALQQKAELRWWLGSSMARADSDATLAQIEALRARHGDPEARAAIKGSWIASYERYVGHLLGGSRERGREQAPSTDELAAAFEVSERMRAQMLLEALSDAGIDRAVARDDPELDELRSEIAATQIRLSEPELSGDDRVALAGELAALERREQTRMAALEQREQSAPTASLAEAQAALDRNEALLVYQLANGGERPSEWRGGAWVMVVTRERITAHRLPDERELLARIELFGPLLARREGDEVEAAARLWAALFEPALAQLPASVDRLIIVADGALHGLAFAALRASVDAAPLISSHAISFAPSASSLVHWRRARVDAHARGSQVLALADPLVHAQPAQLYASSIVATQRSRAVEARLASLPRARREAERAVQRGGELWVGEQAGEAALRRRELADFGVLHFATHALVDTLHPGRSAIVLARHSAEHDGLLQPRDIVELDLHGKLVVLSACSSASGAVIDGEGVMGLAHALFRAGAHTVVGSLWPIRDDDALALFERFYVHLDQGLSVDAALAAAQRDRIAANAPPAAWAGVVVLGDGSLVLHPASTQADVLERESEWRGRLALALACLAVLALLLAVRSSRSRAAS